jgi:tRNA (Thr-GGU) A37 N-methylase
LLEVKGSKLTIAEFDILDGTPVLDIKPYSPGFDSFPDAKGGWLDRNSTTRESADDRFTS